MTPSTSCPQSHEWVPSLAPAPPEGLMAEGAPAWEEEKVRENSDPMCKRQQQRQPHFS